MKKITLLFLFLVVSLGYSQTIPVDFDSDITVTDNWKADSGLASVAVVDLPADAPDNGNAGEINSSSAGALWQNAQLRMVTNYLDLTTATANKVITLDVYAAAPQDFLLKLESTLSGAAITTEKGFSHPGGGWATIPVDFNTPNAGQPVPDDQFKLLVIFPGWNVGTGGFNPAFDSTTYVDNVTGAVGDAIAPPSTGPAVDAPTPPARDVNDVISIFSNAYTNVAGTDFNPNWGQSGFGTANTANEIVTGSGNLSLHYPNFNYQGNQYGSGQDISAMEFLHVDIWVDGSFNPNVFVISSGAEIAHPITNTPGSWVSVDIAVPGITGDLTNAIQFKFDGGNGSDGIYVDNLYFWKTPTASGTDATLSDLQVDAATVAGFSPNTEDYTVDLPAGTVIVPQVTLATTTDPAATVTTITQAPAIPGDATVLVTAQDGTTTKTYTVSFVITSPGVDAPTPPTRDAADVISIFSNAYTDVAGTDFNPNWGQTGFGVANTANEIVTGSGNLSLEYPSFGYQGNQFGSAQDISAMEFLHVDIWTNDANPNVYVISSGAEIAHPITAMPGAWKSVEIPIAGITGDLTNAIQFKFDGGSGARMMAVENKIYLDNLYFYKGMPLNVDEFNATTFNIYPNPTTSNWNVNATQIVDSVEVFDILGKSVLAKEVNSKDFIIETSNLNSGLYFARFNALDGVKTIKLIKE